MAKYWTEAMIVMKLMWFKVFLVFFIPFGMSLQQQTETWSGETWDATHWFLKYRTLLIALLLGLNALYALFDKTTQKVETEITKHRAEKHKEELTNTQFIEKA